MGVVKHELAFPPVFEPSEYNRSGFEVTAIFSEHVQM